MLKWLFQQSSFRQFSDSFALKAKAIEEGIVAALRACLNEDQVTLLVVHFPAQFEAMQKLMESHELPYEISVQAVGTDQVVDFASQNSLVRLTLAQSLEEFGPVKAKKRESNQGVSVVVAQRHPLLQKDDAIKAWCKALPFPVRLGYYLSLEDPLISLAIPDGIKTLLTQYGAGENELINSGIVGRQVGKFLKRVSLADDAVQPADSLSEWLQLNIPHDC